jgi:hypothetical protein
LMNSFTYGTFASFAFCKNVSLTTITIQIPQLKVRILSVIVK